MNHPTCDLCQNDLLPNQIGQQTADTVLCLSCLRRINNATTPNETDWTDNANYRTGRASETTDDSR